MYQSSQIYFLNGVYGSQGSPGPLQTPGNRMNPVGWRDNTGNFYIFAGDGFDKNGQPGLLNDIWKIVDCATQTISISSTDSVLCSGSTATLTVSGAASYSWSTNQSSTVITVSPVSNKTFSVFSMDLGSCYNYAATTISVSTCIGINDLTNGDNALSLYPNPAHDKFSVNGIHGQARLTLINILGQVVLEKIVGKDETVLIQNESGIYTYFIEDNFKTRSGKFIIE